MNKKCKIVLFALMVCSLFAFTLLEGNWNLDPNYSIRFSGKKAEGTFSGLVGTVVFDKDNLANAKIDVAVDAGTIKTGNTTKDKHARGDSWLDVAKYPQIKFTSSSFAKNGALYLVTGVLELHGVKKQIQIPFNFSRLANNANFAGSFKINRKDDGINGNMMGFLVGDEFDVTLNVPVTQK